MKEYGFEISGHLDIIVAENEEEFDGKIEYWKEVYVHGDPEGLRSLAMLILKIADLDQEKETEQDLPVGAREHYHLRPNFELAKNSVQTIVGRLDAKGTGAFYKSYVPKKDR